MPWETLQGCPPFSRPLLFLPDEAVWPLVLTRALLLPRVCGPTLTSDVTLLHLLGLGLIFFLLGGAFFFFFKGRKIYFSVSTMFCKQWLVTVSCLH